MKGDWKRGIAFLLALIMVVGFLGTAAFAAEGQDAEPETDTYLYQWNGDSVEVSDHRFAFRWIKGWGEGWRGRNHEMQNFKLERTDTPDTSDDDAEVPKTGNGLLAWSPLSFFRDWELR